MLVSLKTSATSIRLLSIELNASYTFCHTIGSTIKTTMKMISAVSLNSIQRSAITHATGVAFIMEMIGLAWKAEIAAEIMAGRNIGKLIYDFKTVCDTASVFAWVVIIVTFSIVFEKTAKYFLGRLANEFKNQ